MFGNTEYFGHLLAEIEQILTFLKESIILHYFSRGTEILF